MPTLYFRSLKGQFDNARGKLDVEGLANVFEAIEGVLKREKDLPRLEKKRLRQLRRKVGVEYKTQLNLLPAVEGALIALQAVKQSLTEMLPARRSKETRAAALLAYRHVQEICKILGIEGI